MPITKAIPDLIHEGSGMAKKDDTRPMRLHNDVANLAEKLAPIFGETVPNFLSNRLRPILEGLRKEAAARLLDDPAPAPKKRH